MTAYKSLISSPVVNFSQPIEFTSHCGFEKLPEKLTQIEIRVIRKRNCKPITLSCTQQSPIYDGKKCSRMLRNVSPGHTELWFFGWTPMNYRKTFPLYPLPIVTFTPYIINAIKPFQNDFKPEKPIIVTIDPRRNYMILDINNSHCDRQLQKLPFIGIDRLLALKERALNQKPDPNLYNWKTFNEHIEKAYHEAWATLNSKKCKKIVDESVVSARKNNYTLISDNSFCLQSKHHEYQNVLSTIRSNSSFMRSHASSTWHETNN